MGEIFGLAIVRPLGLLLLAIFKLVGSYGLAVILFALLVKLVILPLTISGPTGKQHMLERVVELAEQIPDEEQRIFTLSGVIVASDKFINRDYLEQLRRRINMTQLGRLYEKEKIEYGNQKAEATAKKVTKEMALKMLEEDVDIITIMKVTGFSEDELTELQKKTSITV